MDTATSEERPADLDKPLINKPMHTVQAHGAHTSLKWAEETPDQDMEQPVVGHTAADTEWPPLPKTDEEQLSDTDLRQHPPTSKDGNDKTTTNNKDPTATDDAPDQQEANETDTIRKKKIKLEKGGEGAQERKRSRTRHATKTKDKP